MKNLLETFQNVSRGPKTTVVGAIIMAFGGYMIYETDDKLNLTYNSIEVVLFVLGAWLFLLSDDVLKNKKNEDKRE